ncbi:MAG: PIN domain-containing protein [Spartobacteria bacterium]
MLDSNVLSELWKQDPAASVLEWLDSSEWLIPVVVIAEIQEGAEAAPSLARREEISRNLAEFLSEFSSLVVDWDSETALVWARLRHSLEVKRQTQALWDSLIDAMAVRHGIPIATTNGADFRHAVTFNHWTA